MDRESAAQHARGDKRPDVGPHAVIDTDAPGTFLRDELIGARGRHGAVAAGIARSPPGAAGRCNTLIYVLINLRALQRIRAHKEELARQAKLPTANPG